MFYPSGGYKPMLSLTILVVSPNAFPPFFAPVISPLAPGLPDLLEGLQPNSSQKPTDFMTAPPKRASSQEGFFWKTKTLEEMSSAEWESLCDGCARCCLEKLEDEDTGKIYFTHVSCKLLDSGLCACKDYQNRSDKVPDCVRLTPENVRTLWNFRSNATASSNARPRGRRIRCCRCGGPVFLDEIETLRQPIRVAEPSLAGMAR